MTPATRRLLIDACNAVMWLILGILLGITIADHTR